MNVPLIVLRRFSKWLCGVTLGLIFLGGLVKSHDAGLSVPDWPTTYGKFMFAFPLDQMVGGIKFEHTHRMLASIVGLMALLLCGMLLKSQAPAWLKRSGLWAVVMIILQGMLGGLTVIFLLPVWISSMHGVLAQTLFLITVFIAYGFSVERGTRLRGEESYNPHMVKATLFLVGLVFVQLIIANVMRHTNSGLAIPDFPTMGGTLWPSMGHDMLDRINAWRFQHDMDPVTMGQVHLHFLHRLWALFILLDLFYVNAIAYKHCLEKPLILKTVFMLNMAVALQIVLGISTVLSQREPFTATLHVALGAIVLALSFLMLLRAAPLTWNQFKTYVTW